MATPENCRPGIDETQTFFLNELSFVVTRFHSRSSGLDIKETDASIRHYYQLCQRMAIPQFEIERTVLEARPQKLRQLSMDALRFVLPYEECLSLAREFNLQLQAPPSR